MGDEKGYLLMVWSPAGYTLREMTGDAPPPGHEFEEEGRTLVISKIGASPLPDDGRVCAYSVGKG